MKKFLKILFGIFIIIIVGAGSYYLYIKYLKNDKIEPISLVPSDAIFMVETSNLTNAWDEIRETQLWQSLTENSSFDSLNNQILSADSMMHNNKAVELIFSDRKLMLSAHMISGVDYDFIFYIDVEYVSKLSGLFKSLQLLNFSVKERIYKGSKVFEITENESQETISLTIINNILVGSFSNLLLEDVILRKEENFWKDNSDYTKIFEKINDDKLIRFYFNFSRIPKIIQKFTPDKTNTSDMLSKVFDFSAYHVDIQENLIEFDGFTLLQNNARYLSALSKITPQKSMCYELLPSNTAFYLSITFDEFQQAYKQIMNEFEKNNAKDFKSYQKGIKNLEIELEIDVEESLFKWIGNEVTLVKTNPKYGNRNEDLILVLHSYDIELANKSLQNLIKKIQETAPVNFKTKTYKNFDIHFINIKGFFKLIFGDLFESIEKPYFTVIDDYVLFSNSEKALEDLINFYLKGNTLSHNESFINFKDNFSIKSNVNLFVQTPHVFRHIYQTSNNNFKAELVENKDLYMSFNYWGLQMDVDNNLLKTRMIANYDKDAMYILELEELELSSAEELFNLEYENLDFKFEIPEEQQLRKGSVKLRFDNEIIQHEGKVKGGKPEGLWRSYYDNGKIESAVNYENGKANGEAIFYYDAHEEPKKAEVIFDNDEIIETYKEYYKNGNKKAILEYDDGKLDGEAQFYYENEILKIKGEYKDGLKTGKWEYYRENGEVYEKEKWKKGAKK
jgi:antitoxin component YwqK of YwqJK toxin-antitoxin module